MLRIYVGESVEPLAAVLATSLSEPGPDPLGTELVAVPTGGMNRWIRLYLARHLGAQPGSTDGIAANIEFVFPGSIRARLMEATSSKPGADPWSLERLTWTVLSIIKDSSNTEVLGPLGVLPTGATWYARARSAADLLDRYNVHRPDMITQWTSGNDINGVGEPLDSGQLWQPNLWRLAHSQIKAPSPSERLGKILNDPRGNADLIKSVLPPRFSVFGSSSIPGGPVFLELAQALSEIVDIDLYLVAPSLANPEGAHPLLATWGRPATDTHALLTQSGLDVTMVPSIEAARPDTLLTQLAADIRSGQSPTRPASPGDGDLSGEKSNDEKNNGENHDASITVHSCFGATRQLEACRDSILRALADDPTLNESDITVLVPDLVTMTPLIPGVFGPPARFRDRSIDPPSPPIDYVITDRSLEIPQDFAAGLLSTLELLSSRFTRTDLLSYLRLPAVRERFRLESSDLTLIDSWATSTEVKWGLNPDHRSRWGITSGFTANTWRHGTDQLLMGVAISDDEATLATDGLAVQGVEGASVITLGRLASLISQLETAEVETREPLPVASWVIWARDLCQSLIEAGPDDEWQAEQVLTVLGQLSDDSAASSKSTEPLLEFSEFGQLLTSALQPSPGRNRFYTGGVTITSMAPMRWLPSKVTIIVGLDEAAFSVGHSSGDDLVDANPRLGDVDRRNEIRQSLLETILSTTNQLVITRTGFSQKNNTKIPAPVALAELLDTLSQMVPGGFAETTHARQLFDPRHLDAKNPSIGTFDRSALDTAAAKARPSNSSGPLASLGSQDQSSITVSELHTLLRTASRVFFFSRLNARFLAVDDPLDDNIPLELGALENWALGNDALHTPLDTDDWKRFQAGIGAIPPGLVGQSLSTDVKRAADSISAETTKRMGETGLSDLSIDLNVDGTRIIGLVSSNTADGILQQSFSNLKPKALLRLWLDLMLVTAQDLDSPTSATLVHKSKKKQGYDVVTLNAAGPNESLRALGQIVDLYRLALTSPIPVFGDTSYAIARGTSKKKFWESFGGGGDAFDVHNEEAWQQISLDKLMNAPTVPGDPGHPAESRFQAYADHLWAIVDFSLTEPIRV